jgi:hypothetical protein
MKIRFPFTDLMTHRLFKPAVLVALVVIAYLIDPVAVLAAPIAAGVLTEGQHAAEFILSEAPGKISRDTVTVTVPANTTLAAGFVLAQLSGTGKYVPYDNTGSDGSEAAAGILYSELANATGAPVDKTGVIVNAVAEVRKADLIWNSGMDASGKTAAYADLAAQFVKARD